MSTMRISQLAERSGVPATTLRFYEGAGLLPADRTPAGYRVYGEAAVDRLAFIGAAKHLGLPLEEVAELLTVWETGACADVKADLRPRIAARIADAQARTSELAAFTTALQRALDHLDALPDRQGPCDPECGFLGPDGPAAHSGPRPVGGLSSPGREVAGEEAAGEDARWRNAPVACSLDGDGVGDRAVQWRELTDGAERRDIPEGVRLTLPAGRVGDLAALAASEQQCCPFFDFRLHLDGSVVHFEVRAPDEGAGLLAELFGEQRA